MSKRFQVKWVRLPFSKGWYDHPSKPDDSQGTPEKPAQGQPTMNGKAFVRNRDTGGNHFVGNGSVG